MPDSPDLLVIEVIDGGLRLSGEIDASCIELLSSHLNPLPGSTGDVSIHLGNIVFIDSSGLRELIDAHQHAEQVGRRVLMTAPSAVVTRMFEIAGLSQILHIV